MPKSKLEFPVRAHRRHFHGVTLIEENNELKLKELFENLIGLELISIKQLDYHKIDIYQFGYITDSPLSSIGHEVFSKDNNGKKPYQYDIFLITRFVSGSLYHSIFFPFNRLGRDIMTLLQNQAGILENSSYLGVNINSLVRAYERKLHYLKKESYKSGSNAKKKKSRVQFKEEANCIYTKINAVDIRLKGDSSVSSVNLSGDEPLTSPIYKKYLRSKLRRNVYTASSCVVSCKTDRKNAEIEPMHGRIYFDLNGNYRLYMHHNASNVQILTHLIPIIVGTKSYCPIVKNPFNQK